MTKNVKVAAPQTLNTSSQQVHFNLGWRNAWYPISHKLPTTFTAMIYDCMLTSVGAMQAGDVHTSFLFVADLNSDRQE